MSKAVAKKGSTALGNISDFEQAASGIGSGLENVTGADLLIPRLTILQGLSPQVTRGTPEYDESAKVGMVWDVGLEEGWNDPVPIIPVHYVKQFLEWAPRNSGKGLQGIHDDPAILDKCVRDDKNRMVLPSGNYIAETAQLYCLNVAADFRRSFIPMTSTQLKKARRLLTLASSEKVKRSDGSEFTPPLYYRQYILTTVPESNAEGNWMGWKIERGEPITELPNWNILLEDIRTFREALTSGRARGDMAEEAHAGGSSNPDGAM